MEKTVGLLTSYYGRDKILRTTCFVSMLVSSQTKGQTAKNFGVLARQIGSARTILRLFDDLPMLSGTFKYGLGSHVSINKYETNTLYIRGFVTSLSHSLFSV